MALNFAPGWSPEIAKRGLDKFFAQGGKLFQGPKFADDNRPLPGGFSLSNLLLTCFDQGQVGSCFSNMGANVMMLMMTALKSSGKDGNVFIPSRRLIWYQCRKLDGSLGSWQDGGSIVNSFAAIGDAPNGVGDVSEEEWPYKADHWWLEKTPPSSVLQNASKTRIHNISELQFDPNSIKRSVYNGNPIGIGIYWPNGWDSATDKYGRTTGIGYGGYGHAVTIIGWVDDWDGHTWYEIQNSHGAIYGTPPPDIASKIPGLNPTKFSFWAREDHLQRVCAMKWTEIYHASGVDGFVKKELDMMLI